MPATSERSAGDSLFCCYKAFYLLPEPGGVTNSRDAPASSPNATSASRQDLQYTCCITHSFPLLAPHSARLASSFLRFLTRPPVGASELMRRLAANPSEFSSPLRRQAGKSTWPSPFAWCVFFHLFPLLLLGCWPLDSASLLKLGASCAHPGDPLLKRKPTGFLQQLPVSGGIQLFDLVVRHLDLNQVLEAMPTAFDDPQWMLALDRLGELICLVSIHAFRLHFQLKCQRFGLRSGQLWRHHRLRISILFHQRLHLFGLFFLLGLPVAFFFTLLILWIPAVFIHLHTHCPCVIGHMP